MAASFFVAAFESALLGLSADKAKVTAECETRDLSGTSTCLLISLAVEHTAAASGMWFTTTVLVCLLPMCAYTLTYGGNREARKEEEG